MKITWEKIKYASLFLMALTITISLWRKDQKIDSLEYELKKCQSSVIYINTTDTIIDTKVEYVETKVPSDTAYLEVIEYLDKKLSLNDSLDIAKKVMWMITDYNTKKYYDNVFKDDSSAYIQFKGTIYKNEIVDPSIIFKNRYPAYIEVPARNEVEIYAGFGGYTKGITVNAGLITRKNVMYQVSVDPINKYYGGSVNFKIFGFK